MHGSNQELLEGIREIKPAVLNEHRYSTGLLAELLPELRSLLQPHISSPIRYSDGTRWRAAVSGAHIREQDNHPESYASESLTNTLCGLRPVGWYLQEGISRGKKRRTCPAAPLLVERPALAIIRMAENRGDLPRPCCVPQREGDRAPCGGGIGNLKAKAIPARASTILHRRREAGKRRFI